ncbi:MAG: radical SAM protein [Syntrophobacteraceae bacterium]|nr:radical SAM protein [Syntrophobacteraceae bacterium]
MALPSFLDTLRLSLFDGGPGFSQVAVTNRCNADCAFCNFARSQGLEKHDAPADRLLRSIDVLYEKGIRYVALIGGEPLLYPDMDRVVSGMSRRGMEPIICTNGWLLSEKRIRRLADTGIRNLIISIDAPDAGVHDKNRGLPGLTERIRKANAIINRLGMHSTASVTISRLLGDIKRLPTFLDEMGFADLTFSYPLQKLYSTYLSYSDSRLVEFSACELLAIFEQLKALKKHFRVLNPTAGMDEMMRFLRNEPARFPCLAGYKYFFIDWNLDVYRCHYLPTRICSVEDLPNAAPVRDNCARCMIDCYREPSILQYCAVALADSWRELKRGRLRSSAACLFNSNNVVSLEAVAEQFELVRRYKRRRETNGAR